MTPAKAATRILVHFAGKEIIVADNFPLLFVERRVDLKN